MLMRAWKEDDTWGIDEDRSSVGVRDRQSSFVEHMKVARLFVEVRGGAAERPGVEHPGGEGELLEEWGEAIHIVFVILLGINVILKITIRTILSV